MSIDTIDTTKSTQEQAVAAWIGYLNQLRIDGLLATLKVQDANLEQALRTLKDTAEQKRRLPSSMAAHVLPTCRAPWRTSGFRSGAVTHSSSLRSIARSIFPPPIVMRAYTIFPCQFYAYYVRKSGIFANFSSVNLAILPDFRT